jgi:hypothetical protein
MKVNSTRASHPFDWDAFEFYSFLRMKNTANMLLTIQLGKPINFTIIKLKPLYHHRHYNNLSKPNRLLNSLFVLTFYNKFIVYMRKMGILVKHRGKFRRIHTYNT